MNRTLAAILSLAVIGCATPSVALTQREIRDMQTLLGVLDAEPEIMRSSADLICNGRWHPETVKGTANDPDLSLQSDYDRALVDKFCDSAKKILAKHGFDVLKPVAPTPPPRQPTDMEKRAEDPFYQGVGVGWWNGADDALLENAKKAPLIARHLAATCGDLAMMWDLARSRETVPQVYLDAARRAGRNWDQQRPIIVGLCGQMKRLRLLDPR